MPRKHGSQPGSQRRITIPVPLELSNRIDAAVNGLPGETLKSLTLRALEREIDRLEEERGTGGVAKPFPPAGRPPPGRPRKNVGARESDARASAPSAESSDEVERLMHVLERREHDAPPPRARGKGAGEP